MAARAASCELCTNGQFYIYNLGYHHLFPSLNGGKYPLTQSMQVEIGVVAAATLVSCQRRVAIADHRSLH